MLRPSFCTASLRDFETTATTTVAVVKTSPVSMSYLDRKDMQKNTMYVIYIHAQMHILKNINKHNRQIHEYKMST